MEGPQFAGGFLFDGDDKPNRLGLWYTCCMPTVLRIGGLRVVVYFNDHRPAHVHVIGREHEAVFELNTPRGSVTLRENYGFTRREIASIRQALIRNLNALVAAWERIHGTA